MIWHSADIGDILKELDVDEKKGLPNGVAEMRLDIYGKNIITNSGKQTFLNRIFTQLKNKSFIALTVACLIAFATALVYSQKNAYTFLIIVGLVLVNVVVGAFFAHKSDNILEGMKSKSTPEVTVLREGNERLIPADLLVPGDIILLSEGDYVSADARIIECNEFRCNESAITGDEIPVEKNNSTVEKDIAEIEKRTNMVFSGTSVAHGTAKAVVVNTGLNTEMGTTHDIMQQTGKTEIPFNTQIKSIGKIVDIVVIVTCVIIFIIGMIQNFSEKNFAFTTLNMIVNSMAVAVAAIPEWMSGIAAVVIAIGVKRFSEDKIIVKDVDALENLEKTEVICSDKTGVLTRNKMNLTKIFDGDKVTQLGSDEIDRKTSLVMQFAVACSTLNNDSTEDAIKKACLTYNSMSEIDVEGIFPKLNVIPFDSERKMMTVITMINETPYAIVKGAPEFVIPLCINCDNDAFLKVNEQFAEESLRVVCIAIRPLSAIPANPDSNEIENDLTFVGLLGLDDPPRETVIDYISACKKAGIRTVMITGDGYITAKSVARRIGILTNGTKVITGDELAKIDDEELSRTVGEYSVIARALPNDKLRIVKAWQNAGKNVTVTGDSISDAEALSTADVGCAIGRYGTDVAKGSADVIISHNRFDNIVSAIKESRGLLDNIKKVVGYILSSSNAELFTVLLGLIIFSAFPLSAVLLLWINLLTDFAQVIALSMEKAEDSVFNRRPYVGISNLLNLRFSIETVIEGLFIAVMTLVSYAVGNVFGGGTAMSMAFITLGLAELVHCYNKKQCGTVFSPKLFSNKNLNYSFLVSFAIIAILTLTPAGNVFGLTVLTFSQFIKAVGLSLAIIPVSEIIKLINKVKGKSVDN